MVTDTRSSEIEFSEPFDVCVVGAGAAGISLALELSKKTSARIALLDAGGLGRDRKAQDDFRGEVAGDPRPYPSLHRARHAGLGGSTEVWAGWSRPLDPLDFERRDWVPNSGWPIGPSDLGRYYERANRWCGLGPLGYDLGEWEAPFEGAASLADGKTVLDRLFRVRRLRFRDAYFEQLRQSKQVETYLRATTLRFHAEGQNGHVSSVSVALGNGKRSALRAKRFALASGGLENPRLLLLSGESPERAIGNERGLVGRYFTEHGFVSSGWFEASGAPRSLRRYFPIPHPQNPSFGFARHALGLSPELQAREQLNNAILYFHPGYESSALFDDPAVKAAIELWEIAKGRAAPGDWGQLLPQLARGPHQALAAAWRKLFVRERPRSRWRLRCYYECVPLERNRVELAQQKDRFGRPRARLDWRPAEQDIDRVRRFHELLSSEFARRGHGRLAFPQEAEIWRRKTEPAKHPMGATRMADSPACGVVDRDCRVHGTDNLYVAGSSVFPTAGYANPTLTIVALALRLADHIGREFSS